MMAFASLSVLSGLEKGEGLPDPFKEKSPRSGKLSCASPCSQLSTAPSTPCHDFLPVPECTIPDLPLSPATRQITSSTSIPEEDESEEEDISCYGMPALQSELGRNAQNQVEAEEWLEQQKEMYSGKELYLVDNDGLQVSTSGLAYRKSKHIDDRELEIEGPKWGTTIRGIVDEDGWLKVGRFYLPMALEGVNVLTPVNSMSMATNDSDIELHAESEPMADGPAFTEDGRVVDLDGGMPIFFASDRVLTSSHSYKRVIIAAAKHWKKAQSALDVLHAAEEVDAEAVCSLDSDGYLRGEKSFSWKSAFAAKEASNAAKHRLKLFHEKRMRRQPPPGKGGLDPVVGIDPDGKAFLMLYLSDSSAKRMKTCRQELKKDAAVTVFSIDLNGTVRDCAMDDE